MKLFVDMPISPKIVTLLSNIGCSADHARDHFSSDTDDSILIRFASENSMIILTHDKKMSRAHQVAYEEYQARAIFLTSRIGDASLIEQIAWYEREWAKCFAAVMPMPIGGQVRFAWDGGVRWIKRGIEHM